MRLPRKPPDFDELLKKIVESDRIAHVLATVRSSTVGGTYRHWEKLRFLKPPEGLSMEEWWFGLKLHRSSNTRRLPLLDTDGNPFFYNFADPIPEQLHWIDHATGQIPFPEPITTPGPNDRYRVSSLIEEAITSSQLEGAAVTRDRAKAMIRAERAPRNHGERMIMNNFLTMERISKTKSQPLSKEMVFEIHRQVTEGTLEDPTGAGRFRRMDEQIEVTGQKNEILHLPPAADQLEDRMATMCAFANGEIPDVFVHPVLRSIILHFWLACDHPFVDGNGRTARALFYWSMLNRGYWFAEYFSISRIMVSAPAKYGRAFLYTESDDNDLTYFVLYHLSVIRRAVKELNEYVKRKTVELRSLERELRGYDKFNHRQRALLTHALRHSDHQYTIGSHRRSHNVTHETARKDLHNLSEHGVLESEKIGREWYFQPVPGLDKKIRELG